MNEGVAVLKENIIQPKGFGMDPVVVSYTNVALPVSVVKTGLAGKVAERGVVPNVQDVL